MLYENCIGFSSANLKEEVSEYYATTLSKTEDLQTNCCKTSTAPAMHIRKAIGNIHDLVLEKYYGCGFVAPDCLKGLSVLDLGCGSGRDVYLLSQLVGETGRVVGVDMTDEQLEPARSTMLCSIAHV